MAKTPDELKKETGRRLKQLYKDTGIDQRELAKMIGRKENALSPMANGKATLTERTAKLIHDKLPSYSVEYLTGASPYRNDEERELAEAAKSKHDGDLLALGVGALSEVCGFTLTATLSYEAAEPYESGWQKLTPTASMIVARDGKSVTVPRSEIKALQTEIRDFVDFKLSRMLNR